MENTFQLLSAARKEVARVFAGVPAAFTFHNQAHTVRVVTAAGKIMQDMPLSETDRLTVLLACWFHDAGFSGGHLEDHETLSIKIAEDFLQRHSVDEQITRGVHSCIAATRMPQKPVSLLEQIICDADLAHLGSSRFPEITGLLKEELQWYLKKQFTQSEWDEGNIAFMSAHHYFTPYARARLEPVKQQWIQKLINRNPKG